MCGSKYASVQGPRLCKMDGLYYMTFAYRPYAWSSLPTGVGVPYSNKTLPTCPLDVVLQQF